MNFNLPKADFNFFERQVRRWQKDLGLVGWDVCVEFVNKLDGLGACVSMNKKQMDAFVSLSRLQPEFIRENKRHYIAMWACHEMLHVLLNPMDTMSREVISDIRSDAAEHGIINAIVSVLKAHGAFNV